MGLTVTLSQSIPLTTWNPDGTLQPSWNNRCSYSLARIFYNQPPLLSTTVSLPLLGYLSIAYQLRCKPFPQRNTRVFICCYHKYKLRYSPLWHCSPPSQPLLCRAIYVESQYERIADMNITHILLISLITVKVSVSLLPPHPSRYIIPPCSDPQHTSCDTHLCDLTNSVSLSLQAEWSSTPTCSLWSQHRETHEFMKQVPLQHHCVLLTIFRLFRPFSQLVWCRRF